MMRSVARCVSAVILMMTVAAALAQEPVRKPTQSEPAQNEPANPQTVSPTVAPTKEEAEDKVKAPVGIQAMPTAAPVDPNTYVLGMEDIILVRVFREPDLSFAAQIRPDGKVTMQLVGDIQAAGLTPDKLKASIVEKLAELINKPEVTVSVQSVLSRRYYITGEVNRPGAYPLVIPITLMEALSKVGGLKEFANAKKITILRNGKLLKFNYKDSLKGKNLDQNILVENGDFINVP
ncbi:MAG: polysaccharide biosynthesis/export family protein [Bryobacteraceae bacterium]|nr:polysaccharide biosynthesis/export family protein [Bryobacteraceae bacterium]